MTHFIRFVFVCISFLLVPSAWAADKLPTIFVAGFLSETMGGTGYFKPIKESLRQQGYPDELLVDFNNKNTTRCIQESAEELKLLVEKVRGGKDKKVNIIAHSLGGVISRYFIQNLSGKDMVDNLITLSSPHHGTITSSFFSGISCSARESVPSATLIRGLNGTDPTPEPVKYTAIVSELDVIVVPKDSMKMDGRAENQEFKSGHFTILHNPDVHKLIAQKLMSPK